MRTPVAQVGDGNPFRDWLQSQGFVTKVVLFSLLFTGAGVSFGWLDGYSLILVWPLIFSKFQVFRLFTNFFFAGTFSFQFAIFCYVFYGNCSRYEVNPFNTGAGGSSADFLWMMIVCMAMLLAIGYFFNMPVLSDPLLCCVMYVWSRREPDVQMNMFGFKYKAIYQPLTFIAFRLLTGNPITGCLFGFAVGHVYYFLVEVLPATHGRTFIHTPRFCVRCISYFTNQTPPAAGNAVGGGAFRQREPVVGVAGTTGGGEGGAGAGLRNRFGATAGGPAASGGYTWGQGRVLGTN